MSELPRKQCSFISSCSRTNIFSDIPDRPRLISSRYKRSDKLKVSTYHSLRSPFAFDQNKPSSLFRYFPEGPFWTVLKGNPLGRQIISNSIRLCPIFFQSSSITLFHQPINHPSLETHLSQKHIVEQAQIIRRAFLKKRQEISLVF
jgi:hypothetical protein